MAAIARRVNQQVGFARHTLDNAVGDSSVADRALIQGGYFQLELAVIFYLAELRATNEGAPSPAGDSLGSSLASVLFELAPLSTADEQEISNLGLAPESWLHALLAQLDYYRGGCIEGGELAGAIFEAAPEHNLLSVVNVTDGAAVDRERPSVEALMSIVESFGELVARQRSISEQY